VACAGNPEDGFAFEQFLDRRKRDDSARRANTVFGAGLAAHALALDMVKTLAGLQAVTAGRIVVFDLITSKTEHHVVLRKPACPACGHADAADAGGHHG
jgi:adenylyltransferase/sulfurtransferase